MLGEAPGIVEDFYCWFGATDPICALARASRRGSELATAEHQRQLAEQQQAAAQTAVVVAEAQTERAREQTSTFAWMALPAVGALVLVAGGIGAYFLLRRSTAPTYSQLPLAQLSDDELERLIYERQFEAGVSGVTGALTS